ncbi:hypothetical protein BH11BAC1_BH11BAC1_09530 [soil metagenome]
MKNLIRPLFTLLFVICISSSFSSASDENPVRLGIKAGVNFSNLYAKDDDKTGLLTGFNAGLFAKLPLTTYLAFQPELYYTAKGAEITYKNIFAEGTASFHLNYIELPLMLVGNITKNFNIHAGPYVGFLIKAKVKNESNVSLFDFEDNLNTDDFNKLDAGLAIGAGLDVKAVSIGLRYIHGLTNVGKERTSNGNTYTYPDAYNGVINIYITLSLN